MSENDSNMIELVITQEGTRSDEDPETAFETFGTTRRQCLPHRLKRKLLFLYIILKETDLLQMWLKWEQAVVHFIAAITNRKKCFPTLNQGYKGVLLLIWILHREPYLVQPSSPRIQTSQVRIADRIPVNFHLIRIWIIYREPSSPMLLQIRTRIYQVWIPDRITITFYLRAGTSAQGSQPLDFVSQQHSHITKDL